MAALLFCDNRRWQSIYLNQLVVQFIHNEAGEDMTERSGNLVLIGMIGVGKTAVGRQLAEQLAYDFVDLDAELEAVCGLKLNEIYRRYGRIRFYAEETLLLKKQLGNSRRVIAAGGALPPKEEQVALWRDLGATVWLKADPETILRRIRRKQNRLFLPPHATAEEVELEIARRALLYEGAADYQVELDQMSLEAAVNKIAAFARQNL